MKILHLVQFYEPSKGGMQEVVRQLSGRLVELGHEVHVYTSYDKERVFTELNGVKIKSFKISGNEVNGIIADNDEVNRFQNDVVKNKFDIVTIFAAQHWACDLILPIMKEINAKKVFVPTGFSALFSPGYEEYFKKMKYYLHEFDANVFLAEEYRDIDFAKKSEVKKITIIPNGADEKEFLSKSELSFREKYKINNDDFLILHVGSYTNLKGHREALRIYQKSEVRKSVLVFVGNIHSWRCYFECKIRGLIINWFSNKKVLQLDLTRKETVAAFKESDLFLFPSNIECSPIVLFEACASRTPFLVTDVGNSREITSWTQGGRLLPTVIDKKGFSRANINESAKELMNIWLDDKNRKDLARRGFRAWRSSFSWDKVARKYEQLYKSVLKENVIN